MEPRLCGDLDLRRLVLECLSLMTLQLYIINNISTKFTVHVVFYLQRVIFLCLSIRWLCNLIFDILMFKLICKLQAAPAE